MTSREEVEEMAEVAFQRGESDRLIWIVMEVALDIRDLLQRLQPPTIINADALVPTLDTDTRKK